MDDGGAVRIGSTRVSLDTVIISYSEGNTAEEIVQQYPSLSLADVYATIAYYLKHHDEVEEYLRQRRADAIEIRKAAEQISDQRVIRERLLAREKARKMDS